MPAKNSLKRYVPGGYYHLYNRSAFKQEIFKDDQDYRTLLSQFPRYLLPSYQYKIGSDPLHKQIDLIAYCLMPNHYHLLVRQHTKHGITEFTRTIFTNYAMYFNQKYDSSGTIFQGKYKAAYLDSSEDFIHVSRYLHQNPFIFTDAWIIYPYSSLHHYLAPPLWLKRDLLLAEFNNSLDAYLTFVKQFDKYPEEFENVYLDAHSHYNSIK